MAITYAEVASSGISEDDFNTIFNSDDAFLKKILIHRHVPNFTWHDEDATFNDYAPFSVYADDTKLVRVYNRLGNIYHQYMLVENNDSTIINDWTAPVLISTGLVGLAPQLTKSGSTWICVLVDASGVIQKYTSTDGTGFGGGAWSGSAFCATALSTTGLVTHIAYVDGNDEVVYYWKKQTNSSYALLLARSTGVEIATPIIWHDAPTGLHATLFTDTTDDANALHSHSSERHLLVASVPMPGIFTYETIGSATPVKTAHAAGGIISWVVRPKIAGLRSEQFSKFHPLHTYDDETSLQYRRTCHISSMSSIHGSSSTDTMWVSVIGGDGDENGTDISFGYKALYYYSSRDGMFWSRDKAVPIADLTDFSDFDAGVQMVRCGNYVYLISARTTLRSLSSYEFGVVHPDWTINLTEYITSYSSSSDEMRQSNIVIDNPNGVFNSTILMSGASFALETYIGKHINGADYYFKVSTEEVDTIQPNRERPNEQITISSRDRLAWLSDKTENPDPIQYDTQLIGLDTFDDIGGVANSGLSHVETVKGTFATKDGTLRVVGKYKEAIELSTFKQLIADGGAETTFQIPDPVAYGDAGLSSSYAGIVYRATDKDNFNYVKYNFDLARIELGYRRINIDFQTNSYAVPSEFRTRVRAGEYVSFRIEFKHNILRVWTKNSSGVYDILCTEYLAGNNSSYTPIMQGQVGQYGAGWSDEVSEDYDYELPPIGLSFDGSIDVGAAILLAGVDSIAAFNTDGKVYITTNFSASPPTWTNFSLGLSGTMVQFVVDAFSPGYIGTGSSINGWVATTTSIYYVTDIFSLRTVTLLKSLRATCSFRSMDASFGANGEVVLTSAYTDGVYSTRTVDGAIWTNEILVGAALNGARFPGIHVSSKSIGKVYSSAIVSAGVMDGYSSFNSGTSWSRMTNPDIDPGGILAGDIHVPYGGNPSESIAYLGRYGPNVSNTTWSHTLNFLTGQNGFTALVNEGVYSAGTGFTRLGTTGTWATKIVNNNSLPGNYTGISITLIATVVTTLIFKDRLGSAIHTFTTVASGSPQTLSYSSPFSIAHGLQVEITYPGGGTTPSLTIQSMIVSGAGNDPYATWSFTFNFLTSDGGWLNNYHPGFPSPIGIWISGTGWRETNLFPANPSDQRPGLWISKQANGLGCTTSIRLKYVRMMGGGGGNAIAVPGSDLNMLTGTYDVTLLTNDPLPEFFNITFQTNINFANNFSYITELTYTGIGQNPFAALVASPIYQLTRVNGRSKVSVSPVTGYLPWKSRWQISSNPLNRLDMATACGNSDQSLAGIYTSRNGGDSWSPLVVAATAGSRYERVAVSGDGNNGVYVFGTNGVIGYSNGLSGPVVSKKGLLTTTGEHIGICGGPLT